MAAKLGDKNPDNNPRLRLAILQARKNSMPNDNIKRAIDKASGANTDNFDKIFEITGNDVSIKNFDVANKPIPASTSTRCRPCPTRICSSMPASSWTRHSF